MLQYVQKLKSLAYLESAANFDRSKVKQVPHVNLVHIRGRLGLL